MDEVVDQVVGCAGGAEFVGLEEQLFDDEGAICRQIKWCGRHMASSRHIRSREHQDVWDSEAKFSLADPDGHSTGV